MNTPEDPSVFEDDKVQIKLTESDLLGKHIYKDVLYTGKELKRAKNRATRAQQSSNNNHPHVAKKARPEGPFKDYFSAVVFYNRKITGGLDWHTMFNNAMKSDSYDVTHQANYDDGTLIINVTKS